MVFSSVPLYLDSPNWQQQHPNQQVLQGGNNNNNNINHPGNHEQNLHLLPPQQQPHQLGGMGGGPGTQQIRPNSMAERARLAKIPAPEAPLKCPRCESTNTKFCYFNNYSLTQPRHFCKTCRRYWTRNGNLRNVPVGGGCRRNKRSSSKSSSGGATSVGPSSSKSSLSSSMGSAERHGGSGPFMTSAGMSSLSSLTGLPSGVGNMSFMASLQNIAQLGGMSNMGLAFSGSHQLHNNNNNNNPLGGLSSGGGVDHNNNMGFPQLNVNHNHHSVGGGGGGGAQFPNFLGGFEMPGSGSGASGLYSSSFQSDHHDHNNSQGGVVNSEDEHEQVNNISKNLTTMITPVKMEENAQQGLNLAKQLMGISSSSDNATCGNTNLNNNNTNHQFWGGSMTNNAAGATSMWTDLSGLNSSSTTHLL